MKCECDIMPAVIEMLYTKAALFWLTIVKGEVQKSDILQNYVIFTLASLVQNKTWVFMTQIKLLVDKLMH